MKEERENQILNLLLSKINKKLITVYTVKEAIDKNVSYQNIVSSKFINLEDKSQNSNIEFII